MSATTRILGLLSILSLAGCGGGDGGDDSPDGPADARAGERGEAGGGGDGAIGTTYLLNPTSTAQATGGIELAPYEIRRLTGDEARALDRTAAAGHDRVVCVGGKASFRLEATYYSANPMGGGAGPAVRQKWADVDDVEVACDHGLLEDAPETVVVGAYDVTTFRTELAWSPRSVPRPDEWTDALRRAVLGRSLAGMPEELVTAAQKGLDDVRDPAFVGILLRLRLGSKRHPAYDRRPADDMALVSGLLGAEHRSDLEAIETELGAEPSPQQLGALAVCWAGLDQTDRVRAWIPGDEKDLAAFFGAMAGADPVAIWSLAGGVWPNLSLRPGQAAIGQALLKARTPLPVEAIEAVAEAADGPGMIQLSADLLEPWSSSILERGAALGIDRLIPMLRGLLAHPNDRPARKAIDHLLTDPAAWPAVLGAWPALGSDSRRGPILETVLAFPDATDADRLPFALAALDGDRKLVERALGWIGESGVDLPAGAPERIGAALVRTGSRPTILWTGGPAWWPTLLERWADLPERDRTAALASLADHGEAGHESARAVVEVALADSNYRIVDRAIDTAQKLPGAPVAFRRQVVAAAGRRIGGERIFKTLDPTWWGDVLAVWKDLPDAHRQAAIGQALARADIPAATRRKMIDQGLEEKVQTLCEVLRWLCDHPGEATSGQKRAALRRAKESNVPGWLAEKVERSLR